MYNFQTQTLTDIVNNDNKKLGGQIKTIEKVDLAKVTESSEIFKRLKLSKSSSYATYWCNACVINLVN